MLFGFSVAIITKQKSQKGLLMLKKKTSSLKYDIEFTKTQNQDNNTEYTIIYKSGLMYLPDLTKMLCNNKNDILAYIDIKHTNQKYAAQFKNFWVNIQEFHPELIGDFKYEINKNQEPTDNDLGYFTWYPGYWQHDTEKHLYTFKHYTTLGAITDWFLVHAEPDYNGQIETNFHFYDKNDTRFYRYHTHPFMPTDRIEQLKQQVLLEDGVITPRQIRRQKIKEFFQRKK